MSEPMDWREIDRRLHPISLDAFDMEKVAISLFRIHARHGDFPEKMVRAQAKHILLLTVAAFQPPR